MVVGTCGDYISRVQQLNMYNPLVRMSHRVPTVSEADDQTTDLHCRVEEGVVSAICGLSLGLSSNSGYSQGLLRLNHIDGRSPIGVAGSLPPV